MTTHPYKRSPHSNAGNCTCGMAEESSAHPHAYTQARRSNLCVCAQTADNPIHTDAETAQPNPTYPEPQTGSLRGTDAARDAVRQARGDHRRTRCRRSARSARPWAGAYCPVRACADSWNTGRLRRYPRRTVTSGDDPT